MNNLVFAKEESFGATSTNEIRTDRIKAQPKQGTVIDIAMFQCAVCDKSLECKLSVDGVGRVRCDDCGAWFQVKKAT